MTEQLERETPKRRSRPGARPTGRVTGPPAEKVLQVRGSLRKFLRMLRPERPLLIMTVLLSAGSVLASVFGPKVLGDATNVVFNGLISKRLPSGVSKAQMVTRLRTEGKGTAADMLSAMNVIPGHGVDFAALARILGVVALIYLGAWALGATAGRTAAIIVQRSMLRLRTQVESKLSRLPLSFFDSQSRGEVLSRVTNDIDNLGQTLQETLTQTVTAVLTLIGMLAVMLWVSWLLTLIVFTTVPASLIAAKQIAKRSKSQFVKQSVTIGRLNGHIDEMYTGHTLVKLFGRQHEAAEAFHAHNETLYNASFRAQFVSGLMQPVMMLVGNLNYVLVAVIGGLRVATGTMSIGDVQAFIQYSRQFTQPTLQLASMANLIQAAIAYFERVQALLETPEQASDPAHPADISDVRGSVAFEHVSFRYQPDTPLIDDLSLRVEPGQMVAIVGPTGAGKTTLVNLLMRFYDVTGGRITVDRTDIATMTRERLRSLTGMVLQDAWLFGGTIAENIAYGADSATHADIVAAARAAHIDHFVGTLPNGYDTVIEDEGGNVSAGEKQLITIARAFLAKPSILVLDEATSSVDTRTELLVQRGMNKLRQGRTSFIIAHRLSTIRDADLILVMEDGRIVEQGNHDELRVAGGTYQRLQEAQFSRPSVYAP